MVSVKYARNIIDAKIKSPKAETLFPTVYNNNNDKDNIYLLTAWSRVLLEKLTCSAAS